MQDTRAEYDRIVSDLRALTLATATWRTFQNLHPGLQQALNDLCGYGQATARDITAGELIRERRQKLLHLQDMAHNMTGRIFWGPEHIFYVRVMKVAEAEAEVFTVPPRHLKPEVTGPIVDYMV